MTTFKVEEIFAAVGTKPLLFDGANGSVLTQLDNAESHVLWSSSLLFTQPYEVYQLHKEYVTAGADIITTNTFRTNPVAVRRSGVQHIFSHLVGQAVDLAREAVKGTCILVAGSNPPAEDCYQRERTITFQQMQNNHLAHIDALMEGGVDLILNETFSHLDEIRVVNTYCSSRDIPFIISLYFDDSGRILSGERVQEVIDEIKDSGAMGIGFNCIKPSAFRRFVEGLHLPEQWGFYLNCGIGDTTDGTIKEAISPAVYASFVESFLNLGPTFVGACCGSTPAHIREMRKLLDQ